MLFRSVTARGVVGVFWYVRANSHTYQKTPTTPPAVVVRRHDRLGCTIDPIIANPNPNTPMHVLWPTKSSDARSGWGGKQENNPPVGQIAIPLNLVVLPLCMVTHIARVWINLVRLPILLVVS